MNKIYDNGYYLLGKVNDILNYYYDNNIDDEIVEDVINELKLYDKNSVVCINYDSTMGCTIEEFTEKDVIWEMINNGR